MNSFGVASLVEAKAVKHVMPLLDETAEGRLVMTSKGALARHLQEIAGDVIMQVAETMWTVELKAEIAHTGNLFLECFSNRNLDVKAEFSKLGMTPGWMLKLRADILLYYFVDVEALYVAKMFSLLRWAFGSGTKPGNIWTYPLKRQNKYAQMNDTWGWVVPVDHLIESIGLRKVFPRQIDMFPAERRAL